ncbi:MAG: hypothetical protein ACQEXJ_06230 [Myxococcota bacterium]
MLPSLEIALGIAVTALWFAPTLGLAACVIRTTRRHAAFIDECEPRPLTVPDGPVPSLPDGPVPSD